jgi:muramoyltetrapeptide carboxypeptidase
MPCQIPAPLQPGDLLYVVATSGALREFGPFQQGIDLWRARGYRVEVCPGVEQNWGYLAGPDNHRRQQLLNALKAPDCRGILCARGGYGGTRLLEDWVWPEVPPKWLIGFSDITSLLWSWSRQGVSGVHGPLLTTLSQEPTWSLERLWHWVERQTPGPTPGRELAKWSGYRHPAPGQFNRCHLPPGHLARTGSGRHHPGLGRRDRSPLSN